MRACGIEPAEFVGVNEETMTMEDILRYNDDATAAFQPPTPSEGSGTVMGLGGTAAMMRNTTRNNKEDYLCAVNQPAVETKVKPVVLATDFNG